MKNMLKWVTVYAYLNEHAHCHLGKVASLTTNKKVWITLFLHISYHTQKQYHILFFLFFFSNRQMRSDLNRKPKPIVTINAVNVDLLRFQDFIECLSHQVGLHHRLILSQILAKLFLAMLIDLKEYDICHTTIKTQSFIYCVYPCKLMLFHYLNLYTYLETWNFWNYLLMTI